MLEGRGETASRPISLCENYHQLSHRQISTNHVPWKVRHSEGLRLPPHRTSSEWSLCSLCLLWGYLSVLSLQLNLPQARPPHRRGGAQGAGWRVSLDMLAVPQESSCRGSCTNVAGASCGSISKPLPGRLAHHQPGVILRFAGAMIKATPFAQLRDVETNHRRSSSEERSNSFFSHAPDPVNN